MKTLWERLRAISSGEPVTGEAACRETLLKRLWQIKIAKSERDNLVRIFLVTAGSEMTILEIQNGDVRAEYILIDKGGEAMRKLISKETEELLWVMDTSAEEEAERLRKLFHEMWTAALESPRYDKHKWLKFIDLMKDIGIPL
ncbi:MAG TPA: hypothetical protein PKJ37_10560 [Acidobacteriota bacterium]|nr:hypothetical protein [Acidobacteriota bacterium]HNT18318.1 hypothetical protein [Acidobacteriota bacterium]